LPFAPSSQPDLNLPMIGIEEGAAPQRPCIHLLGCRTQPQHYMGLDGNARDVYSRVIYGAWSA
jgi:ABC-type dipeptide/oligopeptide/nickel transport system permease subunit